MLSGSLVGLGKLCQELELEAGQGLERSLVPLLLLLASASKTLLATIPWLVFALGHFRGSPAQLGKPGKKVEPEGGPGAWKRFGPTAGC